MKNKILYIVTIITLSFPLEMCAQANFRYVANFSNLITYTLTTITFLLIAFGLAWFFWGLISFIRNADDQKSREGGRQKMLWGIIALFVVISMWGLVALYQQVTNVSGNANGLESPEIPH